MSHRLIYTLQGKTLLQTADVVFSMCVRVSEGLCLVHTALLSYQTISHLSQTMNCGTYVCVCGIYVVSLQIGSGPVVYSQTSHEL